LDAFRPRTGRRRQFVLTRLGRVHDQMGVAMKNGIEPHPILDITFND
jgi:hypothetical protein